MSIIVKMCKMSAIYWGPPSCDGDGGETYPEPVEIDCRWEEVEGKAKDERSKEEINNSTVYVDRDVKVGGFLYDGSLSDVTGLVPSEIPGARKILGFQKLPNIRCTEYLRIVTI